MWTGSAWGLAVVREIVTTLRGHVDVRSVVGEGSEFVDAAGRSARHRHHRPRGRRRAALPHASVHRDRRALVVDDDDNARETLGAMLSALGIDADLCGTGQEGVARFGTGHYDIVVIDLELPDVSGFKSRGAFARSRYRRRWPASGDPRRQRI